MKPLTESQGGDELVGRGHNYSFPLDIRGNGYFLQCRDVFY